MKKSVKTLAIGLALCVAAVPLGACGVKVSGDVNVAKKSLTMEMRTYVNQPDIDLLELTLAGMGQPVKAEDMGLSLDQLDKVVVDGKEYYTSNDPEKGLYVKEKVTSKQMADAGCILDKNKFVMYQTDETTANNLLQSTTQMDPSALLGDTKAEDLVEFMTASFTFDKTPIASNGKIAGKTVTYADMNKPLYWTAFTKKASKAKASTIKPSIKNKSFTKKQLVSFKTPGIIKSYKVDGKSLAPYALVVDNKVKVNTVRFAKQGKHKVTVKLTSKASKTFTFTYDKGKPTANVKASKSYKAGKKLVVKDKYKLKYAKLDGKKLKLKSKGKTAKKTVKKKGSHKLVVADKAGNKLTVKFKIK